MDNIDELLAKLKVEVETLNQLLSVREEVTIEQFNILDGKMHELGQTVERLNQEIASHQKIEQEIRDSEERLKILFEYAPDVTFITDARGAFIQINKKAEEVTGYKNEELVGKSFVNFEIIPASRFPKAAALLARFIAGQDIGVVEFTIKRKDGTELPVEVRVFPIKIKGQTFVLGTARDISERKRTEETLRNAQAELELRVKVRTAELAKANDDLQREISEHRRTEQALRHSEERFKKIASSVTDYIYTVLIKNGKPVQTIHASSSLGVTGYTPEEFQANPMLWLSIVPEEDRQLVLGHAKRIISDRDTTVIEHRIIRKDGSMRWVSNRAVFQLDEEGNLISYDGLIRDITERKLAQEALIQAKTHAEEASKIKTQFLANMSHEIRTPMNAIIGFSELLETTNLDTTQKDYVFTIRESGHLLLALINDVLDVSKIEAGGLRLEKIDFDLDYLVRSVLKINSSKLTSKDIELFCDIDKDVPVDLKGDPTRIRQILMNLVGNAVKFTQKGEIRISVRLKGAPYAGQDKTRCLEFSIKDTGIGIPKDKQKKIFEAFEQADFSTTRKYGGTGLGLAISKALVERMGGEIWVESEQGKGSEFFFTLNLEEGMPLAAKEIHPLKIEELKGKRILIVDDNLAAREVAENYCREAGMEVLYRAASVDEAWNWLLGQSDMPELILSDIIMPDNDGYELAARIKANQKTEKIKLIAITSDVRPGSAKKAQESGFDAYLPKPIIKEELIQVIETTLGDKRTNKQDAQIVTRHMAEELSFKGLRILVVEDNAVNQKLLEVVLKSIGCETDIASNGQVAVEKARANQYDLVLMDIQMPIMGGYEATEVIRSRISKTLPIVALTAAAMKEDEKRSLESGMNDYIAKPVELSKLKEKILQWGRK